jgi:hypothetical protein
VGRAGAERRIEATSDGQYIAIITDPRDDEPAEMGAWFTQDYVNNYGADLIDVTLSKIRWVDQRMRLECDVGFRQLRTCRRTRPG